MSSVLASRYAQILQRIEALSKERGAQLPITFIAASKTQPVETLQALYALGHRDFGENYVQELVDKATRLEQAGCMGIRWHFIGHLQTNKAKALIPYAYAVHSIDSERLARELAKRWNADGSQTGDTKLSCFLEVNIDSESSKAGVLPEHSVALAARITNDAAMSHALSLQGLMAIPAATENPEQAANAFRRLRALEARCQPYTAGGLSMGMSNDYELAIREGATHVRVGTALFGKR